MGSTPASSLRCCMYPRQLAAGTTRVSREVAYFSECKYMTYIHTYIHTYIRICINTGGDQEGQPVSLCPGQGPHAVQLAAASGMPGNLHTYIHTYIHAYMTYTTVSYKHVDEVITWQLALHTSSCAVTKLDRGPLHIHTYTHTYLLHTYLSNINCK